MYTYIKYFLDRVFALIIFLFISPVFVFLAILILFLLGKPIFFLQKRPGYKGKIFTLIKFRTMRPERSNNGDILNEKQRITKLGDFLRKYSLDELPELINIVKGDMSFIGPRPLLCEYMFFYTKNQLRRHNVKPGLSGWAQLNGRNTISWEKKFQHDLWYVDNISFLLDIKIFLKTLFYVFNTKSINNNEFISMPKFSETKTKNTKEY